MTCTYLTSLDRECGRDATHGPHSQYCRFHSVLHEFETNCGDPAKLREAVKQ